MNLEKLINRIYFLIGRSGNSSDPSYDRLVKIGFNTGESYVSDVYVNEEMDGFATIMKIYSNNELSDPESVVLTQLSPIELTFIYGFLCAQ